MGRLRWQKRVGVFRGHVGQMGKGTGKGGGREDSISGMEIGIKGWEKGRSWKVGPEGEVGGKEQEGKNKLSQKNKIYRDKKKEGLM